MGGPMIKEVSRHGSDFVGTRSESLQPQYCAPVRCMQLA